MRSHYALRPRRLPGPPQTLVPTLWGQRGSQAKAPPRLPLHLGEEQAQGLSELRLFLQIAHEALGGRNRGLFAKGRIRSNRVRAQTAKPGEQC